MWILSRPTSRRNDFPHIFLWRVLVYKRRGHSVNSENPRYCPWPWRLLVITILYQRTPLLVRGTPQHRHGILCPWLWTVVCGVSKPIRIRPTTTAWSLLSLSQWQRLHSEVSPSIASFLLIVSCHWIEFANDRWSMASRHHGRRHHHGNKFHQSYTVRRSDGATA